MFRKLWRPIKNALRKPFFGQPLRQTDDAVNKRLFQDEVIELKQLEWCITVGEHVARLRHALGKQSKQYFRRVFTKMAFFRFKIDQMIEQRAASHLPKPCANGRLGPSPCKGRGIIAFPKGLG